jgi:hypothetical protein
MPEGDPTMIWLFQRHGEYLACEVRTCLENAGFELQLSWTNRQELEWYPSESELEIRWRVLRRQLMYEGWGELYASTR